MSPLLSEAVQGWRKRRSVGRDVTGFLREGTCKRLGFRAKLRGGGGGAEIGGHESFFREGTCQLLAEIWWMSAARLYSRFLPGTETSPSSVKVDGSGTKMSTSPAFFFPRQTPSALCPPLLQTVIKIPVIKILPESGGGVLSRETLGFRGVVEKHSSILNCGW